MAAALASCTACILALAPWAIGHAQAPPGADTLSAGAVAESLSVIRTLEARVAANPADAATWHHLGMAAWAVGIRASNRGTPAGLDATRLYPLADSALRLAANLATTNARYRMAVGHFLLASGASITRSAAKGHFERGLEIARQSGDAATRADAAVDYGRAFWRQYDGLANRRMATSNSVGDIGRSISDAMQPVARGASALEEMEAMMAGGGAAGMYDMLPAQSMKTVRDVIANSTQALPLDASGGADLMRANELFREAYEAQPANPRAFRSYAMVLAESGRWREIVSVTQTHLRAMPWDANAWMAQALAQHRMGESKAAAASFDSAFANLNAEERARLDRLERVLRPRDATRIAGGTPSERAATQRLYWAFADPLWGREGNEARVEFLARLTYSDLRWSVEELKVRGADTDRGDIYTRFGPPNIVAAIGPSVADNAASIVTFWLYDTGLMFSFVGAPGFATARTPLNDRAMVGDMIDQVPVRWDNIANLTVDTLPTQVARFRAAADSVDIVVGTRPIVELITASSDVRSVVHTGTWLLAGGTVIAGRDSGIADPVQPRVWNRRVGPGVYVLRAEASADGATRGARASIPIVAGDDERTGFTARGFGISDVLIASAVGEAPPQARWSALAPKPIAGAIATGSVMELVWENYDFPPRDGSVSYAVTVTLTRERSDGVRLGAELLGVLARTVMPDRVTDKVVLSFDRTVPASAAFSDHVQLSLANTPSGSYKLTLEVRDAHTGQTATRSTRFIIHQ